MRETATWAHLGCVHFLTHRLLLYIGAVLEIEFCDSIHVCSIGQVWPCPDAKGAHVLPFNHPSVLDPKQGGVIMDVVNAEQVCMPYAHCTLL